jgi:5-hydroxyisourate hydrolase-like protein (transthyretin family)
VARAAGMLLAILTIAGCNQEVIRPESEDLVIDHAATDFYPEELVMYYAVEITPDMGQSVDSVTADLYLRPEAADSVIADTLLESVALVDDGTGGDILPQDDVYGLESPAPYNWGRNAEAVVIYHAFISGTEYTLRDSLNIVNQYPVINAVTMDTTVTRPTGDNQVADCIFVDVSDGDGVEDVKSVTYQIMKPDSTLGSTDAGVTVFYLYDTGTDNPFDVCNDAASDDGRFSGGITFRSVNALGTYKLMFVAKDYSNATSDTATVEVELQ